MYREEDKNYLLLEGDSNTRTMGFGDMVIRRKRRQIDEHIKKVEKTSRIQKFKADRPKRHVWVSGQCLYEVPDNVLMLLPTSKNNEDYESSTDERQLIQVRLFSTISSPEHTDSLLQLSITLYNMSDRASLVQADKA